MAATYRFYQVIDSFSRNQEHYRIRALNYSLVFVYYSVRLIGINYYHQEIINVLVALYCSYKIQIKLIVGSIIYSSGVKWLMTDTGC